MPPVRSEARPPHAGRQLVVRYILLVSGVGDEPIPMGRMWQGFDWVQVARVCPEAGGPRVRGRHSRAYS